MVWLWSGLRTGVYTGYCTCTVGTRTVCMVGLYVYTPTVLLVWYLYGTCMVLVPVYCMTTDACPESLPTGNTFVLGTVQVLVQSRRATATGDGGEK